MCNFETSILRTFVKSMEAGLSDVLPKAYDMGCVLSLSQLIVSAPRILTNQVAHSLPSTVFTCAKMDKRGMLTFATKHGLYLRKMDKRDWHPLFCPRE